MNEGDLSDEAKVKTWIASLVQALNDKEQHGSSYDFVIFENRERQMFEPALRIRTHGVDTDYKLDFDFIHGGEYRKICQLGEAARADRRRCVHRAWRTSSAGRQLRAGAGVAGERVAPRPVGAAL
ncbi:hypothetical protein M5585_02745 [Serratia ureilytica]